MRMFSPLVAAALGFLAGMVFLAVWLYVFRRLGDRPGPRVEPMRPAEAIGDELIAVLAAAAREALQAPVRLHQVHVHREPAVERWSRAGQVDIMTSHWVEPKR
jgi:hypothetical protein